MFTGAMKSVIINESLMNMNPKNKMDFWQEYYVENDFKFFITNKSRRIGWSYITGGKAIAESMDPSIFKYQKVFVSYGMRDAVGKIADARSFYMNLNDRWKKELATDSKTQLEFWDTGKKSRSTLISIPNQSLRGFGTTNSIGGISLDEFAFHRNDEDVYTSALPCLSRGGNLEIGSTPLVKAGKFYEILSEPEKFKNYKRIEIPWWWSSALCTDVSEAVKLAPSMATADRVEIFGTEIIQEIFASMSLVMFRQEYECEFTDESEAFISLSMIMACTPEENPKRRTHEQYHYQSIAEFLRGSILPDMCVGVDDQGRYEYASVEAPGYDPSIHGILFAGWDMGRKKDASIFTLIGYFPDTGRKHVWMSYELKNKTFDQQKEFAAHALNSLPIRKFLVDKTGLGMDFGEWAETRYPTIAEGVVFTNEVKEVMANKIYLAFEREEMVLPMCHALHADIHCIRKTVTATKHNRYDGSTKDSHADRFWSLCLANLGIIESETGKSQFYQQYQKRRESEKMPEVKVQKKTTGNRDLDALIRRGEAAARRHRRLKGDQ